MVAGLLAALLVGFLWFGNLEFRDLADPDEGRYAEVPREIIATGDWVTPRLNDLKYFEKPPLQYWITAAAYRVFGVDEWVARLGTAVAGLLGALVVLVAGSRLYGREVGALAAAMLLGTLHYALFSHILTLDTTVTLFLTLTVLAFAAAQRDAARAAERRRWMLVAWASAAGAVLTKGLIGLVLPAGAVAAYVLVHRDWRLLSRLELARGVPLFFAICAPWFVVVSMRNPEFARFFFWHEHVERFLQPGHGRPGAWWYFLPILAIGALPWLALLAWSAPRWWRQEAAARFRPTRFLVIWVAVVFLFFSASHSKLPAYIEPVFPALALLGASQVARIPARTLAFLLAAVVPAVVALALLVPFVPGHAHLEQAAAHLGPFLAWFEAGLVALGIALIAAGAMALRGRRTTAILTASLGGLLAVTVAMTGHQFLSPTHSTETIFHRVEAEVTRAGRDVPFFSIETYDPSLSFELERPVTLVAYRGELDMGLAAEPGKGIATVGEFLVRWSEAADAFAIMRPSVYERLAGHGVPMRVLARDARHVVVRRK
ncbi:MAG: glycosyltransferase family 39 protein [Burkholderiales bacterium]|nr:glycosyltransferase family 39 protein [Burkholderiales bacterium]